MPAPVPLKIPWKIWVNKSHESTRKSWLYHISQLNNVNILWGIVYWGRNCWDNCQVTRLLNRLWSFLTEVWRKLGRYSKRPCEKILTRAYILLRLFCQTLSLFSWWLVYQKQVSRAGTSNYIPHYLWDVITCPCPWYMLLAHKSSTVRRWWLAWRVYWRLGNMGWESLLVYV